AGLHVSLISGFIYFCVARFWRLSSYLCLRFPAPKVAALASMSGAIFYAALAGFAIPTQRAIIMIVSFMLCQFMNRHTLPGQSLALALIIVLIWDPLAVFSPGFWLSFAAVSMIAYGMSGRVQLGGLFKKWMRLQMVVSVGVLPFTVLLFQQASIIGLVANFIAVPWVGHIVVPISLLATFNIGIQQDVAHALYQLAAECMDVLWIVIHFLMKLPFSEFSQAIPNPWIFILVLIGVLVALSPSAWPSRWIGIFCLLPIGFYPFPKPLHGETWFHLLDVGQGLSAVIQTENHVLVFDTGPKFGPEFNAGDAVVIPFLHHYGIQEIDTVVLSHGDSDHSGGFQSIQKQFPIHRVLTSVPKKFSGTNIYACEQGQQWWWDGIYFEMLYPSFDLPNNKMGNNRSCVLKITIGKNSILLPGDIERTAEQVLVDRVSKQLASTILVAPHHGSKTSSSYGFVLNVKPRYVLFSVGYRNHFHFPNRDIVARYERVGTRMYQTDETGALTFKLTKEEFLREPERYRRQK
ncbi:MAG: DNA internalization-related competence protein ComEC/Rec2, partial [Proteobacteria bacterium]|nr:DNA internalization-related competence protein ComEC/Rec2 [Pseudomonadota bacterium]